VDDRGGKKKSISDDDTGASPSITGVETIAPTLLINVAGRVSKDDDIPPSLTKLKVELKAASLDTTALLTAGVDSGNSSTSSLENTTRLGDDIT
jgi:hypothetical protein